MDELPPTASLDAEWCSINEAARRLGITATAIRNRIKRGTLDVRPNGNFGRLVRVPRVTLTPKEPVPKPVTLTDEERVALTVTVTVLADHVATLKGMLAKAEAAGERLGQERLEERARADRLAGELADLARKLAELTAAAQARRASSLPPAAESARRRSWLPWRRAG